MKTIILLAALIASPAFAGDSVQIVSFIATKNCTLLGEVTSSPPFWFPNSDLHQLQDKVKAMGGDTLIVTKRGITGAGIAYRCNK